MLKALGAEGPLIRDTYLVQIALLAALGVAIGLAVGAAAPLAIGALAKDRLPIPALFAVYPLPLIKAGAFGLLSAAAFFPGAAGSGPARRAAPAALFRRDLSARAGFCIETVGAVLAGLGLAALDDPGPPPTPLTAAAMIGGVAVSLAILWGLGRLAVWLAGRWRGLARGAVRLGLANLAGPRSAARTATPAIGLGVALLSAVVLIQSSLLAEVREVAPKSAPAVVFTEIPADRAAAFDAAVRTATGPLTPDRYLRLPFATGRITALSGRPVDRHTIAPDQRWAFDSDHQPSGPGLLEGPYVARQSRQGFIGGRPPMPGRLWSHSTARSPARLA